MKEKTSPAALDSIAVKIRRNAAPLLIDGASIITYIAACFLPTINDFKGLDLLLFGWMQIDRSWGWCANPFLFLAWFLILRKRRIWALLMGTVALLLGLNTFTMLDYQGFSVVTPVWTFGVGVYVWLGSMVAVIAGSVVAAFGNRFKYAVMHVSANQHLVRGTVIGGIVLLALSTLGVVFMATRALAPDPTPPVGKITFWTVEPDGDSQKDEYVVNADGTGLARVALPKDTEPSPDGKYIARVEGQSPPYTSTLCVQKVDGSGKVCFAKSAFPDWRPDGSRLVFEQVIGSASSSGIAVVDPDGAGLALLGEGGSPRWSPDGKLIFFDKRDQQNGWFVLGVMNPDGTDMRQIGFGYSGTIEWSPNRRQMVFTGGSPETIFVANADGTGAMEIAKGMSPRWSPDGGWIAFEAYVQEPWQTTAIHLVNSDGTGLTRLTNGGTTDEKAVWSPDGKHIAFASTRDGRKWHVFVMHPDGSDVRRLTNLPEEESYPFWLTE